MIIRNVNSEGIIEALAQVNQEFDGNVKIKNIKQVGKAWSITLTVVNSRGLGAKYNPIRHRRISAACWHVYGEFINRLPVGSRVIALGRKFQGGEYPEYVWTNWSVGRGLTASECCLCN